MYLVRRTPHSDFGHSFEQQTFRCVDCEKEIERSTDKESARLDTDQLAIGGEEHLG